ncbi:MAG TPA: TetR/AcrR family transcriptional regulator [Solirubrobacteraceae bacterium]|jgi:AcrR family transcriptional regulator
MASPSTSDSGRRRRAAPLPPEQRRPMVLDAALQVYLEHGFERASMDAIADAAGVTKPVLYDCFASKQELFTALWDREEERLLAALAGSLPAEPDFDQPERMIAHGFTAFFSAIRSAPDAYRLILLEEQGLAPAAARRGNRTRSGQAERIAAIVRTWLEGRGVPDAERAARLLGHAMVGMGEALGRLMLAEPGRWEPEELGAMVGGLVVRGAPDGAGR